MCIRCICLLCVLYEYYQKLSNYVMCGIVKYNIYIEKTCIQDLLLYEYVCIQTPYYAVKSTRILCTVQYFVTQICIYYLFAMRMY